MRRDVSCLAALAAFFVVGACTSVAPRESPAGQPTTAASEPTATISTATASARQAEYLVFYADGKQREAENAVARAGGTVVSVDSRLGYLMAKAGTAAFPENAGADPSVVGVSPDRRIGAATAAPTAGRPAAAHRASGKQARTEPLAGRQWDMRMIGADRANLKVPGSRQVLVGVIDTGVDGKHPDIAPNFNRELSRNFVIDRPTDDRGETLDGPCEVSSCIDPVDVDDDGHGTHVASTIASPINGIGIAGVAPGVQIVNIRAGQDSGFFFLKPSLDALTYAGDIGVDVVNMSFFVDPWLFNCPDNASDSKKQQLEQRAVIVGMQRALDYARARGVTLVSALGNGATDLGHPTVDRQSPGYPKGSERVRRVDNSCLNVPAESRGVISVAAVGPTGRKAIYSDYGLEQTDVAAPGGDSLDGPGGASPTRGILAAAPEHVLRAAGRIDASGKPRGPDVVRDCTGGSCSYYQYLEGTSMAAPHATGVAAILISRFGKPGKGGLNLAPATVENLLFRTAAPKSCPSPRNFVYRSYGQNVTHDCRGGTDDNGFYGHGIVDAWKAATVEP